MAQFTSGRTTARAELTWYRELFDCIEQGLCIIEVLFVRA
jgi:hypothetical protein